MSEILTGATFLIVVVILLRSLTKGRISMRFRYGLWFIVMLRLVVPVSFGSSPLSVMNLAWRWPDDMVKETGTVSKEGSAYGRQKDEAAGSSWLAGKEEERMAGDRDASATAAQSQRDRINQAAESQISGTGISAADGEIQHGYLAGWEYDKGLRFRIRFVWIAGILIVGGYMLTGRLRFGSYLHRMRVEIPAEELPEFWDRRLKERRICVYQVAGLPSPCLVGRSIYIEPQLLQEKDKLGHVLSHEYAHAVQGDVLWSFMRSLLCAVYWFYPLAWIAAYEAKRDSELACDERAIMILGDPQRFAYGRTLLDLLSVRAERAGYPKSALNMGGCEKSVKERILMIAGNNRKKSRTVTVLVILSAMIICSCAFVGAADTGTGETILLTNEGSLGNGGSLSESRDEVEQPEEVQDMQSEPEEEEEDTVQQQAENRRQEEYRRDEADVEAFGAEHAAFQQVLDRMDDTALASAESMDYAAYYDYLFEGADFPMLDGHWYLLPQKEETGIAFYGLYTQGYGFRGMKIKVGDDVNTFDQPWMPAPFPINTLILEESETDGMPRSFAFELCMVNSGTRERWQLYVADRYDTGTIELYSFREEDCREQLKDQKILLRVDQETAKVELVCEGDIVGTVDISQYQDDTVEEAVWDDELTGYLLEDGRITFVTEIGLKTVDGEVRYQGLPLIDFPVEIGSFGEREFTLDKPRVDENRVSVKLNR